MKSIKIIGLFFTLTGIFFIIAGFIEYFLSFKNMEDRIYTVAYIVKIDEIKTNDPENPKEFITYVEYESNGEMFVSELNTYSSKYMIGDKIDIYYFSDNIELVYKQGSEHLILLFPIIGMVVFSIGMILAFSKKIKNRLGKAPCSEF